MKVDLILFTLIAAVAFGFAFGPAVGVGVAACLYVLMPI